MLSSVRPFCTSLTVNAKYAEKLTSNLHFIEIRSYCSILRVSTSQFQLLILHNLSLTLQD